MSDSVDRVFAKAITTIRALSSRSNYGSLPRPPAENRVKLYGLYKQATEGDVVGIMPRPVGFTPEDEGAKKKWDAWKREEGLSKTEAKRRYIAYLIDTMKVYASGTVDARELLGELEDLWNQIKHIQYEEDLSDNHNHHNRLPSQPPSFGGDRFSTKTPSILGRSDNPYRNNLERIYSHSRKNVPYSVVEYSPHQEAKGSGSNKGKPTGGSVYSMPLIDRESLRRQQDTPIDKNILEDFKTWQGEVNMVINRLTREFIKSKEAHPQELPSDDDSPLKRKVFAILKIVGINALKFLKNFSISVLSIMFIVWCFKKNVVVKRTIVTHGGNGNGSGKQSKELVINMVMNTKEDKWFIRLLSFINSFIGFV
ncbi:uncharacterized protein J8A68_000018 [[Candida] subhashii]|uniref:ACB domain-containing protein n=1 Tax=[Candida] subhashii TaxID=561895 RepID=A0A8J5V628_9ASCO|nr:uncharacterized protein J8A68_000018 [[Candida] subhashii]KAG7666454.1 hypothetical protein J8A68_000018 [[Candida] subhashii]